MDLCAGANIYMMPEMNGLAATAAIRKHWPAEKQPKIIAITAYLFSRTLIR